MRTLWIICILLVGFFSCSSSSSTSKSTYSRTSNVIYEEEIQSQSATSAYDLISRLRPHWLRGRGIKSLISPTASYPTVYVNGVRHGTIESLNNLSAENITMIHYLSAADATTRYGQDNVGGAILITYFY